MKVNLPENSFGHAAKTAELWFDEVENNSKSCVVSISHNQLGDADLREKLISWIGNTPGLTDALVSTLDRDGKLPSSQRVLNIEIHRDDGFKPAVSNPLTNMELARKALSGN